MVTRNSITRSAGNSEYVSPRHRPRKFLFNIGDYEVALRKKPSYAKSDLMYVQIWHAKTRVGYVDLTTAYSDVRTVMSVHTMIVQDYQGLGIAYRVYEGLVNEANISLTSDNQSKGAVKLWRRFAKTASLRLYHVKSHSSNLFDSPIYPVMLNKNETELELHDYRNDTRISPYRQFGSLLLVKRGGDLHKAIEKQIDYHKKIYAISDCFKQVDKFKI